jgi:putative transposase
MTEQEVARQLGIKPKNIYAWRKIFQDEGEHAFPGSGQQTTENAELTRLRHENARLKTERDISKKTVNDRYAFIRDHRSLYPVVLMCCSLGVSRSGFYDFCNRKRSKCSRDDERIGDKIVENFEDSNRNLRYQTGLEET